jgi:hypothetical protein
MTLNELILQLQELQEFGGNMELVTDTGDGYSHVHLAPDIKAFETGYLIDGPVNTLHYAEDRLTYYVEI